MASAVLPVTCAAVSGSSFLSSKPIQKSAFVGAAVPVLVSPLVCRDGIHRLVVARSQSRSFSRSAKVAAVAAGSLLSAGAARAVEAEQIVSALDQVEAFSRQAAGAAVQALDVAKQVTGQVVDAASPLVQAAAPVIADVTKKAVSAATPVATELGEQASRALSDSGVELAPILSAAKSAVSVAGDYTGQAFEAASPYAQATVDNVLAQEPAVLGIGAGALVVLYFVAPSIFGSLAYLARGYAGDFSAAQALDLVSKEDYVLIDIRSETQRAKTGIPSLPRGAKSKLVLVPVEEVDSKLRGQIRNLRKVEADITAIKIAALKRLSKSSRVILIDSNGDSAKIVAQSLVSLGYKNTWTVKDGIDGGKGWVQSKLATETAGLSLTEVLSPSRIIGGVGTQRLQRTGTLQVSPSRRNFLLPSSSSTSSPSE